MVWNKGLKFPGKVNSGSFKKGEHRSRDTEFKKGQFAREKSLKWKGGRYKNTAGYVFILSPEHPYANCDGYVREHRLVVEKSIGRIIEPYEKVHHINGIVDDNRVENLVLCKNSSEHHSYHFKYKKVYDGNLPEPKMEGEKVYCIFKDKRNRHYVVKKCARCNKLFWTADFKKVNYCGISCGILKDIACVKDVSSLPVANVIGQKIRVECKKHRFITKECIRCKKLYWSNSSSNKQKYCGHSCATLMGRYGK
jgi:hypothetical protein